MTSPSSNTADNNKSNGGLIRALVVVAATTCTLIVLSALVLSQRDPFVSATLKIKGSEANGSQLFRINCAGCHGITAQGLVGPNLQDVANRQRDSVLIRQIVSGRTPPMPSFQMDPQQMSDLLAYLESLN